MTKSILLLLVIIGLAFSNERKHYIFLNYAVLFEGEASIGYQHMLKQKNSIGVIVDYRAAWQNTKSSAAIIIDYNFYTRENYFGWWLSPGLGLSYSISETGIPIKLGLGYHWLTRIGIGLGFSFGPGIYVNVNQINKSHFYFLGIADVGYSF
jgi:hypothetical protein